jgi:hypothetical protein
MEESFMKIEKKKVTGIKKQSAFVKGAIASAFGMAATFSLSACMGEAESGQVVGPVENPDSSSDTESLPSSSSELDIPKSQEALSSSAIEALSSAADKLSSSSLELPYPPPEAGVIAPDELDEPKSSSSDTTPASSANEPASSSEQAPYGDCAPDDQKCIDDWRCQHNDPLCPQIYMCDDPKDPRCMMVSMVSTYERTDIT